jgi:opacity protein-like surface antigen
MKKHILTAAVSAAAITAASFAGEHTYPDGKKEVAPLAPVYGTGWYVGLQAGVNAFTDFGESRQFTLGDNDIVIEADSNVGFVGGLKLGYVFGTGIVRPALEADLYYNGIQGDVDIRVNGDDNGSGGNADFHSGAFLANLLVRFCFDRFQPYVGAGVGGYYAEADNIDVSIRGRHFHGDGGSNGGWAWQIIGGTDYYFTEKVSAFAEYKYLNYEDPSTNFVGDRLDQHIAVLGLRWHF